jgi:hypothetical protein
MKREHIEKIIKQGSVRQKIRLYMTDIALVNVDLNNLDLKIEVKPDGKRKVKKINTVLLSEHEREILLSSIKEPKDREYYNNLRRTNNVFLLIKDKLTILNLKIALLYSQIDSLYHIHLLSSEIINQFVDKALKLPAVAEIKGLGIPIDYYFDQVDSRIKVINKLAKEAKGWILLFKEILSKDLPLKPYKDWLKKEEKELIDTINSVREISSGIEGYSKTEATKYEDIEVAITEEDIEDFKSAVL